MCKLFRFGMKTNLVKSHALLVYRLKAERITKCKQRAAKYTTLGAITADYTF